MGSFALHAAGIVISLLMAAARLDESLTLRLGESARVEDFDLTVSFAEVSSDSRCPKDVNCIQAGEAVIQLELRTDAGERAVIELTVPPGGSSVAKSFGAFLVTVVELHPEKESDKTIDPSAYRATVKISRA